MIYLVIIQERRALNSANSISPDPSESILLMRSSMLIVSPKSCLMILTKAPLDGAKARVSGELHDGWRNESFRIMSRYIVE